MNRESSAEVFRLVRRAAVSLFVAGSIARVVLLRNHNTRTPIFTAGACYTELDFNELQDPTSDHPWLPIPASEITEDFSQNLVEAPELPNVSAVQSQARENTEAA